MLTLNQVIQATGGTLIQPGKARALRRVCIDSRQAKSGDLFIAIKGDRFDGHDFVKEVAAKSVAAVIVSQKVRVNANIPVILVKDTVKALGHIARFHRDQFLIPVIAITGSAGKTTTKEMMAAVLSRKYRVLKNVKTENNHIGVPMTLLRLTSSHTIAVLELGTNQPGDIPWLAEIVSPTTAVFTNIGESHLQGLKTMNGVFKEKYSLIGQLRKKGNIIFNDDNAYLRKIKSKNNLFRKIPFGLKGHGKFFLRQIIERTNQTTCFKLGKEEFQINSPSQHNIYNALAAIACGQIHGVKVADIQAALKRFKFSDGRQEMHKVGACWVIDDTYNSNPVSFRGAVQTLSALTTPGKKILVCSDMLELGQHSQRLHEAMGGVIAQANIDVLVTTGDNAKYIVKGLAKARTQIRNFYHSDLNQIHEFIKTISAPGDIFLVKGSRRMRMERTVQFLRENL
jgi:UDP-N-acetylmuramoyl-tripeptide--D-alanyl-D-alanine ligase